MSAVTEETRDSAPTTDAEGSQPKPALGRPHDVFATLALIVSSAAIIYSSGDQFGEIGTRSWTATALSFASVIAALASAAYFRRAYGFSSQGLHPTYFVTGLSVIVAGLVTLLLVSPALHATYGGERELTLILSCLAVAVLAVGPFAAALGRAPERKPGAASEPDLHT